MREHAAGSGGAAVGATADAAEGDDDDCLRAFQRRVSAHPGRCCCHGPAASPLWLAARGRAPAPPRALRRPRWSSFNPPQLLGAIEPRPTAAAAMARRRPTRFRAVGGLARLGHGVCVHVLCELRRLTTASTPRSTCSTRRFAD